MNPAPSKYLIIKIMWFIEVIKKEGAG